MHTNKDGLRTGILATVLLCLSLSTGPLLAATGPSQTSEDNKTPSAHASSGLPPALADRDGDGLSDALQAKLAKARPTDLVDVVVTFSGPGNATHAQRAVGPFKLKHEFQIIPGFAGTMTAAQARGLAAAMGVFRVEEDFQVTATLDAANRDFGTAASRTSYAVTGSGVGICVIDTGVDPGHEQLNGKVADFIDYINGQPVAYDDHSHGTHVSAIAAGAGGAPGSTAERYQGVAPGAAIYGVKALSSAGTGSESDIIAGIQWCSDDIARNATGPGVQVISMSLSSTEPSDGQDAMSQAVNAAVAAGKVVVVGAGNFGAGETTVGSPGAASEAITVGAVAEWSAEPTAANHSRGIYLAPFSSRGPTLDGRLKPDILAPGVSVTAAQANTTSGYVTYSGTSMATPFVSGAVALALENPASAISPAEVKSLLLGTARDLGPAGMDNDWGAGLIDGYRFVAQARGEASTESTPFPRFQRTTETVPTNGTAEYPLEITAADLGVPIAATLTILNGGYVCLYGSELFCDLFGGWAWSPDIDAELIHPNGSVVASSECPLFGDCGPLGRQETLSFLPTSSADIGTYRLRMYQFSSDPGGAQTGELAIDLSTGPVQSGGAVGNQAPEITTSAPAEATEEVLYSYDADVVDPDGPTEIWQVLADDTCGGVINASGVYAFTPAGPTPPTDCTLHIQVCDGATPSLCDDEFATVTINAVNTAPEITTSAPTDAIEDVLYSYDADIVDPDGPGEVWGVLAADTCGGAINASGVYTFTPAGPSPPAECTLHIQVCDGGVPSLCDSELATVTISDTAPPPSLHVGDLDGKSSVRKKNWSATVTITVHDQNHAPVDSATVNGYWTGGALVSCTTGRKGTCKLSIGKIDLAMNSIDFTVETVNGFDTAVGNHDPEADSDGTRIRVFQ